jgi:hypothetical protein
MPWAAYSVKIDAGRGERRERREEELRDVRLAPSHPSLATAIAKLSPTGLKIKALRLRTGGERMKIGAPTILLFLISLGLAGVGLMGQLRPDLLPADLAAGRFWFMVAAYGVLTLGALKREP